MRDVTETKLPGVGVRHEFRSDNGQHIGVVVHHDGRREVVVYDQLDPDACSALVSLTHDDARTLAELLGASQVAEEVHDAQLEREGHRIAWLEVEANGALVGTTLSDGEYRTRTGASIVAVLRDGEPVPAPGPDFVLQGGDLLVAVGSAEALDALRTMVGQRR